MRAAGALTGGTRVDEQAGTQASACADHDHLDKVEPAKLDGSEDDKIQVEEPKAPAGRP